MFAIAMFTIVTSRIDMNIPPISTASGRPQPRPGGPDSGGAGAGRSTGRK
jgi:hypothetical protein